MTPKEELQALRTEISGVSDEIVRAFQKRQAISDSIAAVKEKGNISITDAARESELIERSRALADEDKRGETAALMRILIALSKLRQTEKLGLPQALDLPPSRPIPDGAVAYQGVPGAWGEHAARQLFPDREPVRQEYFEDVFTAVKKGTAAVGVLPIENSHTGAIGEVYDLLRRNACYIVGGIWIRVAQCLIGAENASIGGVREVYSHPEGLSQCRRFLKNRNWDLTSVRNTAVAAQMVAEKNDPKYAAIASRHAAEVYGLKVLQPDIADDRKNSTRFIAIASEPFYDERSDGITVTFSTRHQSGALCAVLQAFQFSGINLTRIESRPVSTDNYRFFADLDANIFDQNARDAIAQASMLSEYFEILGCYRSSEEQP